MASEALGTAFARLCTGRPGVQALGARVTREILTITSAASESENVAAARPYAPPAAGVHESVALVSRSESPTPMTFIGAEL